MCPHYTHTHSTHTIGRGHHLSVAPPPRSPSPAINTETHLSKLLCVPPARVRPDLSRTHNDCISARPLMAESSARCARVRAHASFGLTLAIPGEQMRARALKTPRSKFHPRRPSESYLLLLCPPPSPPQNKRTARVHRP